jgi:hypothetical protein
MNHDDTPPIPDRVPVVIAVWVTNRTAGAFAKYVDHLPECPMKTLLLSAPRKNAGKKFWAECDKDTIAVVQHGDGTRGEITQEGFDDGHKAAVRARSEQFGKGRTPGDSRGSKVDGAGRRPRRVMWLPVVEPRGDGEAADN